MFMVHICTIFALAVWKGLIVTWVVLHTKGMVLIFYRFCISDHDYTVTLSPQAGHKYKYELVLS